MKKLLFLLLTISLIAFGSFGISQNSNTSLGQNLVVKSLDFDDDDLPRNVSI